MPNSTLTLDARGNKLTARPRDNLLEISIEGARPARSQRLVLERKQALRLGAFLVHWLDTQAGEQS